MIAGKTATIFGGTGFIGRHIVSALAKRGLTVKVATRVPEHAYFLRPRGTPGQIVPLGCDYNDPSSIAAAAAGSDYVVNCIGVLFEKRKRTFKKTHVEIAQEIAKACKKQGVQRLVHISALGADKGKSRYDRSKNEGEQAVRAAFPAATILRPGLVFGPEDSFFNMFAEMSRYLPALPLIGGDRTKFQPVYVGDVAEAAEITLLAPGAEGKTYELGGPEILTFRQMFEKMFAVTGRRRCLVSVPFGIAKIDAVFLSLMPRPVLTPDQVETLKTDNVVSAGALTLETLGIQPEPLSLILPEYLAAYKAGGAFAEKHISGKS
jgi:NADH dehydrogenase